MNKQLLRKKMINLRLQQDIDTFNKNNHIIISKVCNKLIENNDNNILIYMDMKMEVAATGLIDKGFNIFITKTMPDLSMNVTKYHKDELTLHEYGFYETTSLFCVDPKRIEVALIPGVAFDFKGNRLGYGKGYYDRFLLKYPHIKRIALAFDLQMICEVPTNRHDQSMDQIITESRVFKFSRT